MNGTKEANGKSTWMVDAENSTVVHALDGTSFGFDKAFDDTATTAEVYDAVAKDIVKGALQGFNGAIFAYGQTSSGKTFTMQGAGTVTEGSGILQLAAADIFAHVQANSDRRFAISTSLLEVYNEEVRDLLSHDIKTVTIQSDARGGVRVNAEQDSVTNFEGMMELLTVSESSRKIAATAVNDRSSRGHTIVRITIESQLNDDIFSADACRHSMQVSTLDLVDLAGSESVRHTGATEDRQKEGGMINKRYVM